MRVTATPRCSAPARSRPPPTRTPCGSCWPTSGLAELKPRHHRRHVARPPPAGHDLQLEVGPGHAIASTEESWGGLQVAPGKWGCTGSYRNAGGEGTLVEFGNGRGQMAL